jgi:hypothetical protein
MEAPMAMWVQSLEGLEVKVTGDFRQTRFKASQDRIDELVHQRGAQVVGEVRRTTNLLVRADSPNWKYGDYGTREERLARYQRPGHESGVLDVQDLDDLLHGVPVWARDPSSPPSANRLWAPYRRARPADLEGDEVVFVRDPSAMEQALEGHASTQNELADFVRRLGYAPLSPRGRLQFDLAWEVGESIHVAEVKSLTGARESSQIRIGLGQVLEYAWRLRDRLARPVHPVLAIERQPSDSSWVSICATSRVLLAWPPDFSGVASTQQATSGPVEPLPQP